MRYQNMENELLENLGRLHTTELGVIRIKKNLSLNVVNITVRQSRQSGVARATCPD